MILPRTLLLVLLSVTLCQADDAAKSSESAPAVIPLVAPQKDKPAPLMAALQARKTTREMTAAPLSPRQVSEVLWCANGVNRQPNGRTTPSALSVYSVEIYVVLPDGIYLYEPARHELRGIVAGDFRKTMGGQDFTQIAPLNLVFVTDTAKFQQVAAAAKSSPEDQLRWAALEAGSQAQNVYLYCAAEKLAAVIRAGVDTAKFSEAARLRPTQKIIAAQTVGQMQ
jgi:SagB-type dehydrogenase family enzyme